MNKYETNDAFPFTNLYLANPNGLQGGSYFSKIKIDSDAILIQMPKCRTKNGIHKTGKKIYTDLLFDKSDEKFETWVDTLSDAIKNLIYEKKDMWFQDDLSFDDIEYAWQDILRSYKKKNLLFRCVIKKPKNISRNELVMVYDEEENNLSLDDIKEDTNIIPLIQLNGLKFTSHSFSIEFTLKQVMILKNNVAKPLIQVKKPNNNVNLEINEINTSLEKKTNTNLNNNINDASVVTSEHVLVNEPVVANSLVPNVVINDVTSIEKRTKVDDDEKNDANKEDENAKNFGQNEKKNINETKLTLNNDNELSNTLEKKIIGGLNEVNLEYTDAETSIILKSPRDVYVELYAEAKRRAKEAKKAAIQAVLELKRIKNKYMLDELESSDDEFELEES
jgi:hypothetical protein